MIMMDDDVDDEYGGCTAVRSLPRRLVVPRFSVFTPRRLVAKEGFECFGPFSAASLSLNPGHNSSVVVASQVSTSSFLHSAVYAVLIYDPPCPRLLS